MENVNHYPLRVGKHSSEIVSDICPGPMKKDRIDSDWEYYGGFLIAESIPSQVAKDLVDAYNEKYAPKEEDCAHSFTEGMDVEYEDEPVAPELPPIGQQIAFLEVQRDKHERISVKKVFSPFYKAIIDNLKAIKSWNETPVYNGEIDVAKVISNLIDLIRKNWPAIHQNTSWRDAGEIVDHGKAAIEMINRFKEEREAKPLTREAMDWVHTQKHNDGK